MNKGEAVKIGVRSLWNRARGWPVCVSFEVTHSCVADCVHCDKGGIKAESALMRPADYRRYSEMLKPGVCQMSGGEPLLREDLEDIIRAVKRPSGLPMVVCVSNSWLLTEERYLSLNEAGVSLFSISLDFPDERHDDFRRIPGLFAKMNDLLPYLVRKYQQNNIVLNSALTHANFAEIPGLVAKAEEWGTQISFSAYSSLRTGDTSLCITAREDLALLRRHIDYLKEYRRRSTTVLNSDYILEQTYRFFAESGRDGCQAGRRFLVVRPDGLINACSMFPAMQFRTREEAVKGFAATRETCDQCYVSIRASTERPLVRLIGENVSMAFRVLSAAGRDGQGTSC
ncbi:MAG: radical SAM protein [Thermoleophilia bacterium]|nr:radical SAM protein [Thermoleophilia bacterium]